jgi:hypothetical protein
LKAEGGRWKAEGENGKGEVGRRKVEGSIVKTSTEHSAISIVHREVL